MEKNNTLVIWDSDIHWSSENNQILLWSSYESSEVDGLYSISEIVEKNANQLRSKYLSIIYELGEVKINGKSVIEHLEIRPDFSYWWMSQLGAKDTLIELSPIDNIIKLIACKDWLEKKNYSSITLVSPNANLSEALQKLSGELNVNFKWKKISQNSKATNLSLSLYNLLPHSLQALVWLFRYLIKRWHLKGVGLEEWKNSKAKITFVSYLLNTSPVSVQSGQFESQFWTSLIDILNREKVSTNWIHLYIKNNTLPTSYLAKKCIDKFNLSQSRNEIHTTLDSFLSFSLVFRVLKDWHIIRRLNKVLNQSIQNEMKYYYPLLRKQCFNSFLGKSSISNLLFLNLFERAMIALPKQSKGVYLQENEGWEFGLIYAWRASGHSPNLMGFPHTTPRHWDLRYFFDSRSYNFLNTCNLPMPNQVCVNGPAVKKIYIDGGYPAKDLIEVEALRYMHLANQKDHKIRSLNDTAAKKILLVFGDYSKKNTIYLMDLLNMASKNIKCEIEYLVKPHPACPIENKDYPELNFKVTNNPISDLISMSSLIYTGSLTSAALDAFIAGKPVVSVLDPKSLNMSPLRKYNGVTFIASSKELSFELNKIGENKVIKNQGQDYFFLDNELSKWRELLAINGKMIKTHGEFSL